MSRQKNHSGRNRFIKKSALIFKREVLALFICAAMIAGSMSFFTIVDKPVGIKKFDWKWLAIVSSLNSLPRVYARLKRKREPLIILFSRAFGEGFSSPASVAPSLSKLVTKIRGFGRSLGRE